MKTLVYLFACLMAMFTLAGASAQTNANTPPAAVPDPHAWLDKPMKICVIAEKPEQDDLAGDIIAALVVPGHIIVETVLPEKAAEIRKAKQDKVKESGYTHILLVKVEQNASVPSVTPDTKLFRATLTIQLYDVEADAIRKQWKFDGMSCADASTSDNDTKRTDYAKRKAVEGAANIFQKPKKEEDEKK